MCFIGASVAIVYFMRFGAPQKASYNPEVDNFPVVYLLAPCAVLGVLVNQGECPCRFGRCLGRVCDAAPRRPLLAL